jgi:AraC-like DNA-binding protein
MSTSKGQFKVLRCEMAGVLAVESDTRHIFPRHTHDEFGIGIILRGAQRSSSGRGMVEAGAGDTITVNPGEVHDGAPIGDAGRAWRMLYLDPSVIADAACDISDGKTDSYEFCWPVMTDAGLATRFQTLFSTVAGEGRGRATPRREELLLALLPDVMLDRHGRGRANLVPQGIHRAKALVDDDPAAPITLADLARASGLSRYQVVRGFVRATGLTAHAYIVQQRIGFARRLIAHGCPLAQAAVTSGFADQSHMTRIFVRKFGISPRTYAGAVI